MKAKKLSEFSRTELIDMFISLISGNEMEAEIGYILALFTAMKLPLSSASKHDVAEYCTEELIDLIETGILNAKKGSYEEEEQAWNLILDSIEPDKVFDIIMDIEEYMKLYGRMMRPIDDLRESMLKNYVSTGGRINE